jgi:nicotinamide phosphoribosyltransferase
LTTHNPLTLCDGYKLDHRRQYPDGTTRVYSNWTPRGTRVAGQDAVVFFGLQAFIQTVLDGREWDRFFNSPPSLAFEEFTNRVNSYLGPNAIGVEHIRALHALGYLPLEIRALPEGTLCPLRVPMLTIENTHDDFAWLVNYFETILSASLWLPCTSATTAHRFRTLLDHWCEQTGGDPNFVSWQAHDFSMRGMPGLEAACMSGAGHLLSFTGTDTIPAIEWLEQHYPPEQGVFIGGSVPATEHSVMCAGGKESETATFERLMQLYPTGIVSIVSDTWNLWDVLTKTLPALKDKIMARDGKLVIRPDSGDPVKIICGDPTATGPAAAGVIELLYETFGGTKNAKGFIELDPHIGCIYGDAITYERAKAICEGLAAKGFASTNIVLGVGSFTYQYVTRDTYGFAMKATWARINGEGHDLFKKPVTDTGEKFSATGRLAVMRGWDGTLTLIDRARPEQEAMSALELVWKDGKLCRTQSLHDVRAVLREQSGQRARVLEAAT